MGNWTPGPWITAGPRLSGRKPDWFDSVLTEREQAEDRICELADWPCARDEQNANADLIAVAPELYQELADRLSQTRCGCGHPKCKRCEDDAETERVLAKARGESHD